MDIKALIEKVATKVQSDPSIATDFTKDPKAAVLKIVGTDLAPDVLSQVVSGVSAKIGGADSGIGGAISKIGGLFG